MMRRAINGLFVLVALASPALVGLALGGATRAEDAAKPLTAEAQAAIKACDEGAAVPLDPTAKAPRVWTYDLIPADFNLDKLKPLVLACATAARAAPKEPRLQLQSLRVQIALGGPEVVAYAPLLRPLAQAGSAEASYLIFRLYDRFGAGENAGRLGVSRAEALAALESAADAGHLEAMGEIFAQHRSGPLYRRDMHKAVAAARRIEALPPPPADVRPGGYELFFRALMKGEAARLVLQDAGFTPDEYAAAFRAVEADMAAGRTASGGAYAAALRFGRGTAPDAAKARALLKQQADAGVTTLVPALAEMMANGEGGPVDGKGAIALLRSDTLKYVGGAGPLLATLLLDGRFVGPQPQAAIRALFNSYDLDAAIRLTPLIIDYRPHLDYAPRIPDRLAAGAEADEPGAGLALARLKLFGPSPFTDEAGGRALLRRLADKGDRTALYLYAATQYANLGSASSKPARRLDGLGDDELKALIADGIARKEADAFLLKAKFQRVGVVFPQDDEAATNNLISAANLGSVEGMVLLGDAYDDGIGTAKNPRERLHAWREAAKHGSLEARKKIASAFTFDSFDRLMTLREGITERIALYNDGVDRPFGGAVLGGGGAGIAMAGLFAGGRAGEAGAVALAAAAMDGFRLAPAGLEEDTLVPLLKAFPDAIRQAMEAKLKADGFYKGAPNGFFGPDARKALADWVDAKGPLPPEDAAPAQAPAAAVGGGADAAALPAVLLDRVRSRAFEAAKAVKSKRERRAVITALNALARYGDTAARYALVANYHKADFVRNVVSPAEVTRYALDLMARRPAGTDKVEFDFVFDITQMMQDGKRAPLGDAVVGAIRDTPQLQDPLTLGGILRRLVFAPGGCDAVLAGAKKAGVAGMGDGCDEASQTALIAFAKAKGLAGIESAARTKAATEVAALDKAP